MNAKETRDNLIEFIEREFIGPDPINLEGFIQENGEEILIGDPPRIRYSAGILYPPQKALPLVDDDDKLEVDDSIFDLDKTNIDVSFIASSTDDSNDVTDDLLNL